MNTLYVLNYNNYYNRLILKEETIEDYQPYVIYELPITNFNPNDFIDTKHLLGAGDYDGTGDYVVITDENSNIVSRWFIIEAVRTRGGQYDLTLHRDVIADYFNIIITSPCFIEKATLSSDNPLIFNQEQFIANQIKQSETLLKDRSNCAWLVGYLTTDSSIDDITVVNTTDTNFDTIGELVNWEWYPYSNKAVNPANYRNDFSKLTIEIPFGKKVGAKTTYWVKFDYKTKSLSYRTSYRNVVEAGSIIPASGQSFEDCIKEYFLKLIPAFTFNYVQPELLPDYIGDINDIQGTVIKDADDKFYSVTVNPLANTIANSTPTTTNGQIDILLKNIAKEVTGRNPTHLYSILDRAYKQYKITLVDQSAYSETFNLDIAKNWTNDIYRMVCIPYPDEGKTFRVVGATSDNGDDLDPILITREVALKIAQGIIKKGVAGSSVYDFQLLPYCPIMNSVNWDYSGDDTFISLQGDSPEEGHYTTVGNIGVVFEVKDPIFTFNIQHKIEVKDPKVENQLDTYRLCSPNYSSIFEFSAAKNGGVDYFNVDCTYKPYNPYIHINPNFGLLYGQDFNDARGLILNGDFSLSMKTDAFDQYELQNKNYELVFNRQIQNLEVQQKYQRIGNVLTAGLGTAQGALSGGMLGSMMGGPAGMAAGAAAGGIGSLAGGIGDLLIQDKLMQESLDYTKDLYGYNLENIKARPDTITKVSAINNNNKIYPVLEFYSCTEKEKEAFKLKLKYNGMSVGIIDTIDNYIQLEPSYIKAKLIRLTDLGEDFHVVKTISNELNLGVFL